MARSKSSRKSRTTPDAARRIQSDTARKNGGQVEAKSFAARAQRAAARNSSSQKPQGYTNN